MISRGAAVLLGVALACGVVSEVHSQRAFPTIRPGQSVEGRIAESDPALSERGRFKVYQFRAEPGVRYVAVMRSEDVDSYLILARPVGGITEQTMQDDDGGPEELSARLRFTVPEAGTYLLIAQSLGEDDTGAFTLSLDTTTARAAEPVDIRVGQTLDGELSDDDAEYEEVEDAQGFYDIYRFEARGGERLRLRMTMQSYVPSLSVGRMEDGRFVALAEGESSGGLAFTVPEDGEYLVRAGALGGVTGEYEVTLEARRPAPAPRATPVRRGQSVTGELRAGDAELEDGRWYDAYAYTGRAGETLRITLSAADFDAYVILGRMVDGEFVQVAFNDDAEDADGTDSLLEVELPDDGRYVIQATSFMAETAGEYTLRIGMP